MVQTLALDRFLFGRQCEFNNQILDKLTAIFSDTITKDPACIPYIRQFYKLAESLHSHPSKETQFKDPIDTSPLTHTLIGENAKYRLVQVTIPPKHTEMFHHNPFSSVLLVLSGAKTEHVERIFSGGNVVSIEEGTQKVVLEPPQKEHYLSNKSAHATYFAIRLEIKV